MKITDTTLKEFIEDAHFLEHGNYYFFKDFIVSEIHEGVVYNWEISQEIINIATNYYKNRPVISLISNRINQYSINPLGWQHFFKSGRKLNGLAVVSYTEKSWANVAVEKLFFKSKIERFNSIFEAVNWVKTINLEQQILYKKNQK
ncbi:hypothetical protein KO494_13160 [Lacinutrix sp. C3R15]|uniref:hypothetical protein n=1 Tax=Flavobacteriaceae TaxID=49546 RepID=UPI001C0A3DB9|nr:MULTISPECIES: hypothetical protein [Flavobacteriaceae]MBU2940490.1 hypothetical protein [Lacinutrix sp. C3R15]MDO6623810.1 hypothetical protein [Oceanihabitans sp. 1_MG-2023]